MKVILALSSLRGCRPKASRRRPKASWSTRTQHRIVSRNFSMSPPLAAVNLKGVPGDDGANQQAREKEGQSGCKSKNEYVVRHRLSLSLFLSLCGTHRAGAFNIFTMPGGFNGGRTYCIRLPSEAEADVWVATIAHMVMSRDTLQIGYTPKRTFSRSLARARSLSPSRARAHFFFLSRLFLSVSHKTPREHEN